MKKISIIIITLVTILFLETTSFSVKAVESTATPTATASETATTTTSTATNSDTITLTGILIDEHCFERKSAAPCSDTRNCLLMKACISGGYGIAVLQGDGTYKFYYFDGNFFSLGSTTDGTGGQKLSYDVILKSTKTNNFLVTVTGHFTDEYKPSINLTNVNYQVFNVSTITEVQTSTEASQVIAATGSATGCGTNTNCNDATTTSTIATSIIPATGTVTSGSTQAKTGDKSFAVIIAFFITSILLMVVSRRRALNG